MIIDETKAIKLIRNKKVSKITTSDFVPKTVCGIATLAIENKDGKLEEVFVLLNSSSFDIWQEYSKSQK